MPKHNGDQKVKITSTKFPLSMTIPHHSLHSPSPHSFTEELHNDAHMDIDLPPMVVPELPTIQDQVLVQSSSSNSNKPINATSTSNNHHTVNLEKFGLKIVALNMLGIQPSPHLLICVDCGCGVPPKSTFDHLKFHNIGITFEDKSKLGEVLVDFKCVDHKAILPIPQPLSGPIQHLKVFNAWKCALCNFCSASPGSFKPHFASLHSTKLGSHASNMVSISAQQYFRNAYCFQVTPSLAGLKHGNPYQLYLKNFKPTLTTIDFFPPPTSVNEINPFLRLTQWHEHLKDFIDTRPKVEALLSLLKLPTSIQGNPALGKPLQYLIDNYLQTIRIQANSTTLGVRCLLMECPRYIVSFCLINYRINYILMQNFSTW